MRLVERLIGASSPTLTGTRVVLRAPRASDFTAWRRVREESRAFLEPWEPQWNEDELSRGTFMGRLRRYRQDARERTGHAFFLIDRDSGAICGGITLGHIRRGVSQSAILGYWMGERFAGAGRMSEAVGLLVRYAFDVERLHRLEAACLPRNRRSIALLERCGFSAEGVLRQYLRIAGRWEDHRLYACIAEDRPISASMPNSTARVPIADRTVEPGLAN